MDRCVQFLMVDGEGNDPTSSGFSDQRSDLISYPSIYHSLFLGIVANNEILYDNLHIIHHIFAIQALVFQHLMILSYEQFHFLFLLDFDDEILIHKIFVRHIFYNHNYEPIQLTQYCEISKIVQ